MATELTPGPPPAGRNRTRDTGKGALVIASQTCDLGKKPTAEPEVECLRAFWTNNARIIADASGNSVRHFLLRERDGQGLVADASSRALITKESLLHFAPEQGCADAETERRFRAWLGRRFDRPAVPTPHVEGIQRPIVEALKMEEAEREILPLLRGVREVLFAVANDAGPFRVHLLFLAEEGLTDHEPLNPADSERLAAWFGDALAAAGLAELEQWELVGTGDISVRDYLAFTPLPLDEYSIEG